MENKQNMNRSTEREKFKAQFSEQQWSQLTTDTAFRAAWDSGDLTKSGELACSVLYGDERTKSAARLRRLLKDFEKIAQLDVSKS